MTEAVIKEKRRYFSVFKARVKYRGTDEVVEKYISGYSDSLKTGDEWMEDIKNALANERYAPDYTIESYQLVGVKHQRNATY